MKKQFPQQMSEGDKIAEKSPALSLQLSSLVPKTKTSLNSTNNFQNLLPYNLYLHLQLLQPFFPCSFICTAASATPNQRSQVAPLCATASAAMISHQHVTGITKGHLLNIWRLNLVKETKEMI